MKFHFQLFLLSCLPYWVVAQTYPDHFGTGQYIGISVSSSSEDADNSALNSVNGTGITPDLVGAARFLAQATMGYNYEQIEYLNQTGIDDWLDEQFEMPGSSYAQMYSMVYDSAFAMTPLNDTPKNEYLSYTFYEMLVKEPDFLRQKVAFALSQILVVSSMPSANNSRGFGASDYYDILYQGAFGNYRDILYEVTTHPYMGVYLSTFQNRKADFALGTFPDENYAREIMQLFTIGLLELNNDGTEKLDSYGNFIPTYDIKDIQELSKVFTGFGCGATNNDTEPTFIKSRGSTDFTFPMTMYDGYHDATEKTMIDGTILPAGQTGLQDVNNAIDVLFNHPNIAPFISIRLIQQMVKSNPSPAYVNRVANAFNNNGNGVRGDMQAVVKAILTDPEARKCEIIDTPQTGKLLQPIERFTNLFLAFDVSTPSGKLWIKDEIEIEGKLEQSFLRAPSVFNFFSPFYAESEYVQPNDMVSPEFQILHSTSGIHYLNTIEDAIKKRPFRNRTQISDSGLGLNPNYSDDPILNLDDEIDIFNNQGLSALLDRLNLLLCRGQLSDDTKSLIEDTIQQYQANISNYAAENAVKDAIYFIMISPNYMILK